MAIVARRELVATPNTRFQYVKVHDCDRWLLAVDGVTIAYVEPLAGYEPESLPDSSQFDGPPGAAAARQVPLNRRGRRSGARL